MPDIQVNCGNCGSVFEVSEDLAGLIATCPECESQVSVPIPESRKANQSRLRIKRESTISGEHKCPACGCGMSEDAVICIKCGYDTRTGIAHEERVGVKRSAKPVLAVLGLVILAGIAWTGLKYFRDSGGIIGDTVPASDPQTAPVEDAGEGVQETEPMADALAPDAGVEEGEASEADTEPESSQPVVAEEGVPGETPRPNMDALMRQYRAGLVTQLDGRLPMCELDQSNVLRRANGLVHRGKITQMGKESVVMLVDDQWVEIPYNKLDQSSRLRCDKRYREAFIEYRVRQKEKKLAAQ